MTKCDHSISIDDNRDDTQKTTIKTSTAVSTISSSSSAFPCDYDNDDIVATTTIGNSKETTKIAADYDIKPTTKQLSPIMKEHNKKKRSFISKLLLPKKSKSKRKLSPNTTTTTNTTGITTTTKNNNTNNNIHKQSLVLGILFLSIWTSTNMIAPNLTSIANDFGYTTDTQRDIYFGSYCSLITTILSIPLSTIIGFSIDCLPTSIIVPLPCTIQFCSISVPYIQIYFYRTYILCITCIIGGLSSIGTGYSITYNQFIISRLINSSCVNGTISIVFSIVSDLYYKEQRNIACSGLTAMMGCGVLFGQLYAGLSTTTDNNNDTNTDTVSNTDWSYPFIVSGYISIFVAIIFVLIFPEPVRGCTEPALQSLLLLQKSSTSTSTSISTISSIDNNNKSIQKETFKKSTKSISTTTVSKKESYKYISLFLYYILNCMSRCSYSCRTITINKSNYILIIQGLISSIPYSIICTFLNDYLLQERLFTNNDATYIILWFGIGCAIGGILGGYYGQLLTNNTTTSSSTATGSTSSTRNPDNNDKTTLTNTTHTSNLYYLPIFMSSTTLITIIPFSILLNTTYTNGHSLYSVLVSFTGGCLMSISSVCIRPCILNITLPELRSTIITLSTSCITIGKGIGPLLLTSIMSYYNLSRQAAMNITLTSFWLLSGIQLSFLVLTLTHDQTAMEEELAHYAATKAAEQQYQQQQLQTDNTYETCDHTTGGTTNMITDDVEKNRTNRVENHLMYEDYETTSLLVQQQHPPNDKYYHEISSISAANEGDDNTTKEQTMLNISQYNTFHYHQQHQQLHRFHTTNIEPMIVTIEDRIASFDDVAAIETLTYVQEGLLELSGPIVYYTCGVSSCGTTSTGTTSSTANGTGIVTITEGGSTSSSANNMYDDSRSNSNSSGSSCYDDDYSTDTADKNVDLLCIHPNDNNGDTIENYDVV